MKEQKKPDLRTQKTYDALMDAMRELLVEKDFDKVTVRELCGRARTRTATFYNHFSDKYDFVAFMVRQEHVRKFEFDDGKDPVGIGDYLNELVRSAYNYLDDNSDLLMSLRRNDFLLGLVYTASEDFMAKIKGQIVTYWKASGSEPSVDPDIATQAVVGLFMQCGSWWLDNRETLAKEEAVAQTIVLTKRLIGVQDGAATEEMAQS